MPEDAALILTRNNPYASSMVLKALIPALKGRYGEAEGHIPALLEKAARGGIHNYHVVVRIYALEGKNEEAMKWLTLWANGFFPSYPLYLRDPYLDRIRQYGPFVQFMADMKRRWERYRREFG